VLGVTGLILYTIAIALPFMGFEMHGRGNSTTLVSAADSFAQSGAWELTLVLAATVILLPIAKLSVLLLVTGGLALREPPRWLHVPFRWYATLTPWAMIDVYLIGVFVAYTRLTSMAHVDIGPAAYALGALMLVSVAADAALDREAVWAALEARGISAAAAGGTPARDAPAIERAAAPGFGRHVGCPCCDQVSVLASDEPEPCARCGSLLHRRKPASIARSWSLVIAGAIFYVPANLFPILDVVYFGRGRPSTILGGVEELINAHMVPIAILVFVASITVPTLKLVAMVLMLVSVHRGWTGRLRDRTRLYRIVDVIGRWSMIDVFMLSVLVSLVHLGFIANVRPELGAICFAAVVILTMLAASSFDPRLMWDAAEARMRGRS
jgi:paraquat-inducible protein A